MTEPMLTVADAAKRRRCSVETVRRAIHAKRLRAAQPTPGGPYVIRESWFEEWIERTIVEPEIPEARPRRPSPRPSRRGSLRRLMETEEEGAAA